MGHANHDIAISRLRAEDAAAFTGLFSCQSADYQQYFVPFAVDIQSLHERLTAAQQDRYWGIWLADKLVGFFMLRGFDEGYTRPSYGVLIDEQMAKHGLARLSLRYVISWCRLNQLTALMLKVHPDNQYAKRLYKSVGFQLVERCPRTGHDMLEIRWSAP